MHQTAVNKIPLTQTISILLIEDNPGDARLIREYLNETDNIPFTIHHADKLSKGLEILDNELISVVLLDLKLPDSEGLSSFERIVTIAPAIPVIVLTGLNDENTAIKAVKMGAQDYLVKDKVDAGLLNKSIRYAIERKRAEEEHQKLIEQRVRSLAIIEAQENERRRISRELHDGLGQLLSASKLKLGMIEFINGQDRSKSVEIVKDVENIITKAIIEARRISHDLRPTTLDDFGLVPALRILCQEFSKLTGITVKFQVPQNLDRVDPKIEIAVYRIIQECLNNTSKYAEATEVVLDLDRKETLLFVRVKDNGKGFDMDAALKNKRVGSGFGLLNMKERAELVGGNADIITSPNNGTEVFLEVNLDYFK